MCINSSGIGPTGVFITVDRLLQTIDEHNDVDIYGIVHEMRMKRRFMVQTEVKWLLCCSVFVLRYIIKITVWSHRCKILIKFYKEILFLINFSVHLKHFNLLFQEQYIFIHKCFLFELQSRGITVDKHEDENTVNQAIYQDI